MRSLAEWCFAFRVSAKLPVPEVLMDDLMDLAIAWVKARGLSIGGGFRPIEKLPPDHSGDWEWRFGLYRRDGRPVPEGDVKKLERWLRDWCLKSSLEFLGGYREFTPAEA